MTTLMIQRQAEIDRLLLKMEADRGVLAETLSREAQRARESRAKVATVVRKSRGPALFGLGATLVAALARRKPPLKKSITKQ